MSEIIEVPGTWFSYRFWIAPNQRVQISALAEGSHEELEELARFECLLSDLIAAQRVGFQVSTPNASITFACSKELVRLSFRLRGQARGPVSEFPASTFLDIVARLEQQEQRTG